MKTHNVLKPKPQKCDLIPSLGSTKLGQFAITFFHAKEGVLFVERLCQSSSSLVVANALISTTESVWMHGPGGNTLPNFRDRHIGFFQ